MRRYPCCGRRLWTAAAYGMGGHVAVDRLSDRQVALILLGFGILLVAMVLASGVQALLAGDIVMGIAVFLIAMAVASYVAALVALQRMRMSEEDSE